MSIEIFNKSLEVYWSIYNYILDGISLEQKEICEDCKYRRYYLERDWEISNRRRGENLRDWNPLISPIPSCDRRTCLLDGDSLRTPYIKRLLNKNKLNILKGGIKNGNSKRI